jgi:hypothetical protein
MRTHTPEAPEPGSPIRDALCGWDRFWFSPADPTTLGFIRICAGVVVFYVTLSYSWGLLSYVGPQAWINGDMIPYVLREAPHYAPGLGWTDQPREVARGNFHWSVFFHITDPGWIIAIHVFFLVALVAFTAGLWTRVTSVLAWVAAMSYIQRASTTVFGLDTMMMIVLLYLMIGPSGSALSLDRWLECRAARRRGEPEPELQPSVSANFAIRLMQVHFCIIYFAAGTSKLLGPAWWTGTAMNQVLLNSSFAPMDYDPYYHLMKWLASSRLVWEVAMAGAIIYTLVLEIGLPFLIWVPRWRWVMICASVMLHTGIAVFMGLTAFSLMMIVMLCSFIPPNVIAQFIERFEATAGKLLRGKPTGAGQPAELAATR